MMAGSPFPWSGFALAVAGSLFLFFVGAGIGVAFAVLLLWTGSLWLTVATPPPTKAEPELPPFSRDNMGELIEHSATPLLVQEGGKITIANLAARRALGAHIVGQDPRVSLRQPEAIRLVSGKRSGSAIVRGLVRRRDIWRISKQKLEGDLSVIELSNQTAESDISRAHTDFVANASHELRTPLSSIIGYVETLKESGADVDPVTSEKFLGTVLRESHRLQDLIKDLMSLSRVEAEKHDQPDTPLELGPLVERAAKDVAGTDRVERLKFDIQDRGEIRGDTQQMEQLVRNLVDNALKYGAEDSPVHIQLEEVDGGNIRLSVTDTGEGIPPEHLPHLTRRFYRTDPGRSRASGGTGLGLAIVKHIVERHRGRLDIDSEVGRGTTVNVRIPELSAAADE